MCAIRQIDKRIAVGALSASGALSDPDRRARATAPTGDLATPPQETSYRR
jgi:hypothetical protein